MALPHFTNISSSGYGKPVYSSLFEIHFGDFLNNKYLTDNLHKMDEKYCYFNINEIIGGDVLILRLIDELIKNETKLNVEIFNYNKEGKVLYITLLEGFRFTKIKLLNLDYSIQNIIKPKVRFKYDKMKLYFDYKQYMRRKKLEKLKCL